MTLSLRNEWQTAPQAALAQLQQTEAYADYSWFVRSQVSDRAAKLSNAYISHLDRARPLIARGTTSESELLELLYPSRISEKDRAARGGIKDEALRELLDTVRFAQTREAAETAHVARMTAQVEQGIAKIRAKTPDADVSVFTDSLARIVADFDAVFKPPKAEAQGGAALSPR